MIVEMQELPEDLLLLIARNVLDKEEGLRLWCKLSSACRRLWRLQLPSEPTYFLDDRLTGQGKSWAFKRIQRACKLSLIVSEQDDQNEVLCDGGRATMTATDGPTRLNTLALSTSGTADFLELCRPWVQRLLGAGSLTALSIHIRTMPRSPSLQHLPLRYLEVVVSSKTEWLQGLFNDISCCGTLESLRMVFDAALECRYVIVDAMQLPGMHLHSMPSLKHVRLDNCLPRQELTLPAGCSLFLDVLFYHYPQWQEHLDKFQQHTIVLRLDYFTHVRWPPGIQSFSNLQYLELMMKLVDGEDLADLRHVPHVRIIMEYWSDLRMTAGSWKTLELFAFGTLWVSFDDVDSFVRDTREFTFMSQIRHKSSQELMVQVQDACLRQGRACHVCRHDDKLSGKPGAACGKRVTYVILSTNKQMAENYPVIYTRIDKLLKASFSRGRTLAYREDFWPCDPCESVKRAGFEQVEVLS